MLSKTLDHEQDIAHGFNFCLWGTKPKTLGVIPTNCRCGHFNDSARGHRVAGFQTFRHERKFRCRGTTWLNPKPPTKLSVKAIG
jgi:hypothetical protein